MWNFKERVELIMGKIFPESPGASARHQDCSLKITSQFLPQLGKNKCRLFYAPFDLVLKRPSGKNDGVVQPDLLISCEPEQIKYNACIGAPHLIVEILSKFSVQRDLNEKYKLYEFNKVKEYWVVDTESCKLTRFELGTNDSFKRPEIFHRNDIIECRSIPTIHLNLHDIFSGQLKEAPMPYGLEIEKLHRI